MFCSTQADEREQIDTQAQLLAFDRRNHAGASEAMAANLQVLSYHQLAESASFLAWYQSATFFVLSHYRTMYSSASVFYF